MFHVSPKATFKRPVITTMSRPRRAIVFGVFGYTKGKCLETYVALRISTARQRHILSRVEDPQCDARKVRCHCVVESLHVAQHGTLIIRD